jgi:hypothetical protein
MKVKAAFLFVAPEVDFKIHNTEIDTPALHLYVVGVKNYDEAEIVAKEKFHDFIVGTNIY